jgi:hypothetical protein
MVPQSQVIRNWLGDAPYLFAVTDMKRFNRDGPGADLEAAEFIAPNPATRKPVRPGEQENPLRDQRS